MKEKLAKNEETLDSMERALAALFKKKGIQYE